MGRCICPVPCIPLAVIYVAQLLQMSVPRQEPPLSPLLITLAVGEIACCEVPISSDCGFENRPPISWAMVAVCWLLPSGITNNEASVITSSPPTSTPGSTIRRLCGGAMRSGSVRGRLFVAGITMGILTLVFGESSGAVEVAVGNLTVLFGDELPPVNGEV